MVSSIKKVVNEEIEKNVINESYVIGGDNFNFKQLVKNVYFYNYSGFSTEFDADVTESNIIITWQVSFWLNDMGIENFIISIEKLEGTYNMEMHNIHSDEIEQKSQKNIEETKWKFVINEKTSLILGKSLYVKDLEFDFKNQTCKVNFQ
jgi:hypothetical protein